MDVFLFSTFSHVIKMRQKVDPRAETGAVILIKESSIKVIDACKNLGKAQLIVSRIQSSPLNQNKGMIHCTLYINTAVSNLVAIRHMWRQAL